MRSLFMQINKSPKIILTSNHQRHSASCQQNWCILRALLAVLQRVALCCRLQSPFAVDASTCFWFKRLWVPNSLACLSWGCKQAPVKNWLWRDTLNLWRLHPKASKLRAFVAAGPGGSSKGVRHVLCSSWFSRWCRSTVILPWSCFNYVFHESAWLQPHVTRFWVWGSSNNFIFHLHMPLLQHKMDGNVQEMHFWHGEVRT